MNGSLDKEVIRERETRPGNIKNLVIEILPMDRKTERDTKANGW